MNNLNTKEILPKILICLSVVVIFAQALFFYNQKTLFYLDEAASFQLANDYLVSFDDLKKVISSGDLEGSQVGIGTNSWYTNDEIMSKFTVSKEDQFNYLNTYLFQASDVHPPLYYFIIRTVCSIFKSMDLKLVGFLINITFLLLSLYFVYKISMLLFKNEYCSIAAMLYYGLSFDFVNNSTFYRMYAILTFFMVLNLYLNIKWFKTGFEDNKRTLRRLCLALYFAMLTQYFALFFCLPIFVINLVLMKQKKVSFARYIKYCVITGVIYVVTWPFSIFHMLFTGRGGDVTGKLGGLRFIRNVWDFHYFLERSLFAGSYKYLGAFALLLAGIIVYKLIGKCKKKEFKSWITTEHFGVLIYLFVTAAVYFFIAANAAPWPTDRYVMPEMPLLSIIIIYGFVSVLSFVIKNKTVCGAILISFAAIVTLRWHSVLRPNYIYNFPEIHEYKELCTKYDAVLINDPNSICSPEVELNYQHPNYFETDYENLDSLEGNVKQDGEYIFYIADINETDDIVNKIIAKGYNLENLECEIDSYKIYKLNW
ncbi:hypothetical protein SAMN02910298_01476 [Pseudobutyrivibrio sp. YE44]|nr:hypothetical protein SAMN02910298_01476 [Pseudobutyrivibrio sp. YE44]